MKAWKAELLLFLVTFIWGATFLFTKIGLEYCPPSLYLVFRFVIAFSIAFIFFGKHFLRVKRDILWRGLVLGVFFGGGFVLQTYGLSMTSVSKSGFITGLAVVLTPFAYWLVVRKKINFWNKAGVVVAAIGLWLFTQPDLKNPNLGDILTVLSTLFWAFYITYMDVFTKGRKEFSETMQLVMLQFVASAPIAAIFLLFLDSSVYYFKFSYILLISLAFNGIIASFFLTWIHTSVQRYTTPVKAALIFSVEPVFASILAAIVLHEQFQSIQYIGAVILLSGVMLSELGENIFHSIKNNSAMKSSKL